MTLWQRKCHWLPGGVSAGPEAVTLGPLCLQEEEWDHGPDHSSTRNSGAGCGATLQSASLTFC